MKAATLRTRSLRHYWRTNAAVVLGVATAVAVLAGSLLVGESVRASLAEPGPGPPGPGLGVGHVATVLPRGPGPRPDDAAGLQGPLPGREPAHRPPGLGLEARRRPARRRRLRLRRGRPLLRAERRGAARARGPHRPPEPRPPRGAASQDGRIAGHNGPGRLRHPRQHPLRTTRRARARACASRRRGRCRARRSASSRCARTLRRCVPFSFHSRRSSTPWPSPAASTPSSCQLMTGLKTGLRARPSFPASLAGSTHLEDLGLRLRPLPQRGALALESASGLIEDETVATALRVAKERNLEARPSLIHLANAIQANGREVPYSPGRGHRARRCPASPPSSQRRQGPTSPRPSSSMTGPRRTSR